MTQSQFFMGWQMSSKMPLSDNVKLALDRYIKKYGAPPALIVEHHPSIEFKDVVLPVGMHIVLRAEKIVLPSMLLIGETNETSQMGMEMEKTDEVDMERIEDEIRK